MQHYWLKLCWYYLIIIYNHYDIFKCYTYLYCFIIMTIVRSTKISYYHFKKSGDLKLITYCHGERQICYKYYRYIPYTKYRVVGNDQYLYILWIIVEKLLEVVWITAHFYAPDYIYDSPVNIIETTIAVINCQDNIIH